MTIPSDEVIEKMANAYAKVTQWAMPRIEQHRALRAALRAAKDMGWVMVPTEPTEKMLEVTWGHRIDMDDSLAKRAWRAMIKAAQDQTENKS